LRWLYSVLNRENVTTITHAITISNTNCSECFGLSNCLAIMCAILSLLQTTVSFAPEQPVAISVLKVIQQTNELPVINGLVLGNTIIFKAVLLSLEQPLEDKHDAL
jgi:hypothetical protein